MRMFFSLPQSLYGLTTQVVSRNNTYNNKIEILLQDLTFWSTNTLNSIRKSSLWNISNLRFYDTLEHMSPSQPYINQEFWFFIIFRWTDSKGVFQAMHALNLLISIQFWVLDFEVLTLCRIFAGSWIHLY